MTRWYPQYGATFQHILTTECQSDYQQYLYGTLQNTTIDEYLGGDENNLFVQPVVQCILNGSSDYVKSSLASAQIILGLTPTVLALMGASSEETALLAVLGKRPLLTLLLSIASPSVHLSRAFEYRDPREVLRDRPGRHRQKLASGAWGHWFNRALVIAEYAFVIGALVNMVFINLDFAYGTVCTLFAEWVFMPALWTSMVILIHGVGIGLLRLRARRTTSTHDEPRTGNPWKWLRKRAPREFHMGQRREFSRLVEQDGGKLFVEWFDESNLFVVGNWLLSVGNICHIVFGTLVFSGLTFIGPRDALVIFGRYLASALGCRAVLMFELAGLRDAYNAGLDDQAGLPEHSNCEHKIDCDVCGGLRSTASSTSSNCAATRNAPSLRLSTSKLDPASPTIARISTVSLTPAGSLHV